MGTRLLIALGFASIVAFAAVFLIGGMSNFITARAAAKMADPAEYCTAKGGVVSIRSATMDGGQTLLGEPQVICLFMGASGTDTADTTIAVGGVTLSTSNPTRAMQAYRRSPRFRRSTHPPMDRQFRIHHRSIANRWVVSRETGLMLPRPQMLRPVSSRCAFSQTCR